MHAVVPWRKLLKLIEPMYPQGEGAGRSPMGLERMLRIHFLQHWFNLSDPAVEEALYDSRDAAPDETTVCKFRHLLEAYELGPQILAAMGYKVTTGAIASSRRRGLRKNTERLNVACALLRA